MRPESESKRKLLETAIDLIWESSYTSVSVDDICTKAGVNKGSFYHAFKSKSDLAVAAIERHWEHKQPKLDSIFSPQVPPLEKLDRYCQMIVDDQRQKYVSFGKMLGCPFCSIGCELSTLDEKIRLKAEQMSQRRLRYIESLVRDLAAAGYIEATDTMQVAEEVRTYITGVLMQAKLENSMRQVERLQVGIMRLLGLKQLTTAAA